MVKVGENLLISVQQFTRRVKEGHKLVILDDMVLNTENFDHPGGQYLLDYNIGRDISKFFYGGYALNSSYKEFEHPQSSLLLVNQLKIGRLTTDTNETPVFLAHVKEKEDLVSHMIYRITFETSRPVEGV